MNGRIHIGTSGWHYPHWRPVFYPEELRARDMLRYYAQRLSSVEINNSFYRLPTAEQYGSWGEQTPPGFRFAVKAWSGISHRRKFNNCAHLIDSLLVPAQALGAKLGPILFQLPPRWHCNLERLHAFLTLLPQRGELRYAFEFRDPDWHREEIYSLLSEHNAAFCIFELGALLAPREVTADFIYIRLHGPSGPYAGCYSTPALRRWARMLCEWRDEGRDIWLFFDNDEAGYAVKNAESLQRLVDRTQVS